MDKKILVNSMGKNIFIFKIANIFIILLALFILFSPFANAQLLYNQTIILQNPNFDNNLSGWKNITEFGSPGFSWINSDLEQFGVAQISASGVSSVFTGSLYQSFNLSESLPSGTTAQNMTFSAVWRLYPSDETAATISFSIENRTNSTSCNASVQPASNTSWNNFTLHTNGSNNCFIQNFTSASSAGSIYNIRLRCELTTGLEATLENCRWDNITAHVYYYDTQFPSINSANATPQIINFTGSINFTANVTDNFAVDEVWVSISGINYSMSFVDGIYYFDQFNTTTYTQLYAYIIYANDTSGLSSNISGNFTIQDSASPFITLNSPVYNATFSPGIISFNYTPSDYNLNNCSFYTNASGTWGFNQTNTTPINASPNYFYADLNYGSYLWNVNCCDLLGNCGFNSTTSVVHVSADLEIVLGDVSLSNVYPIHGEIVTIYATIRNLDNITLNNVLISFYDGNPQASGKLINVNYLNFSPFEELSTNTTWAALRGVHEIYVSVNINRTTHEINYSNNAAFNTTYTLSWHTYYGNTTAVMTSIGSGSPISPGIADWAIAPVTNIQANIYVVDSASTISWDRLQALGRNTTNGTNSNTTNDYVELDFCLNSTTYPDNINATYTNSTSILSTYEIYSRTISNVPEALSTNNTNFYTGILWDTSIGYAHYNCSENRALRPNIVFATRINQDSSGKYGVYDYEIRIPEELGKYKGSTNKVSLYYELT